MSNPEAERSAGLFIIKNYFDKAGHNIQEIMKTVIAFLISSTIFGISNGQFGKAAICQFDDGMISHIFFSYNFLLFFGNFKR